MSVGPEQHVHHHGPGGGDLGDRLVADSARRLDASGRLIVDVLNAETAATTHGLISSFADLAERRQVPLVVVELTASAAGTTDQGSTVLHDSRSWSHDGPGVHVVSIRIQDFTAEQIAALLRPVLIGPRRPRDVKQHLDRRLAVLSLLGRPVDSHTVTHLIEQQLSRDSQNSPLLDRWWLSTVVDENTEQPTLHRETFRWIEQFHRPAPSSTWPVSHAGLLHTYGYLLSTAWTPFGWKGDRYLDGTLATLLGVGLDDLTPWADSGTVLSNLTTALDQMVASRPPEYLVVETGQLVGPSGDADHGALRTRVYPPHDTLGERLLVYSIESSRTHFERYVTSFPIGNSGVEAMLDDALPRARFNIAAELLSGSRSVQRL